MNQQENRTIGPYYRLTAVMCIVVAALIAAAVALYFVWPYSPGRLDTAEILSLLAAEPFAGFMTLDLSMVVIAPFNTVVFVGLYLALREQREAFALLALILGAIAFATMITSRPVIELLELGREYAVAPPAAREALVTIGDGLLLYYEGTAWVIQTVLFLLPGLIFAILMRRSPGFGTAESVVGIVVSVAGFGFAIPDAGGVLLLINTIGTVFWYPMLARRFWRLAEL